MNGAPAQSLSWRRIFLAVAAFATGGFAILPMFANSMIYFPDYASRRAPEGLQFVRGEDGNVAVLHLPNPQARFTLWFFHGNAESLGDIEPFLLMLRDRGYAVFAYDYPGYGLSEGRPSEKSVYAATRAAHRYLRDELKVPDERVLLYGRSLGGGAAVELAARAPVAGLVVENAFMSVYRVVTRWRLLPFDQYENLRKLPSVHCPVLVIHARNDRVVPFRHGQRLFAAAREPKRHLWIEGAGHNDLMLTAGERYWETLQQFSELCAKHTASDR